MAMELCINGKFTTDPSADDIGRAFDGAPHPQGWYVVLDDEDDGSNIEVTARPEGTYDVTADDGHREGHPARPFTAEQATAVLLRYCAREPGWREVFTWDREADEEEEESRPAAKRRSSEPPTWAVAIVVGSIALVVLAGLVRQWVPFGNSDYFWIGLIFLPMVVLFVVAVANKMLEVRRAAGWSTAVGRIVKSGTAAEHHRFAGETTTVKTMPAVEYEFSVGGRKIRGDRISVGEDSGGANTEATLRRYTVGAAVTVYYDPANPKNCVLERGVPEGVGKGLAILVGGVIVFVGIVYWLVTAAPHLIEQHYPHANTPVVIFAAAFGLLVLLFFIASWRLSRRAADWPLVRGSVLSSGTERIENRSDGRTTVTYAPAVEYGYRVNDVDYVGRQVKLGVTMSASESYAAGVSARYPKGAVVDVHYDPANPTNAALENPTGTRWLLLVVAIALFALAVQQAGVFS
ncbi:DUF3592 domain-containing protein [Reyranella soli]|jgi:hypothetical protein|uniref:DUF3592 domain-containing protein n=1 Tax=Reyranella soli TaxID=1230389 RepID=A0A512NJV5_9HYPH|nr:DUF3592 domain-containing protein [Reyranella soli]GEP59231.1 hypothetical protein RSO01_63970 [Reyranella soli]